jgi:hypothetical protein
MHGSAASAAAHGSASLAAAHGSASPGEENLAFDTRESAKST